MNRALHGFRGDPVLGVVRGLPLPPPLRLADGPGHGLGDPVRVHDDLATDVPGRPPGRLDERGARAQVALLVGVQDGHQRDLRDVEPLPEEVDADQAVELPQAEIADQGHAVEGVDVGVQVADAHARLLIVLREVLGHALGEGGDEHPLLALGPGADLVQEIVHLVARGAHGDPRIHQACRADDLLDHGVPRLLQLVGVGGGRDVDRLPHARRELVEVQRPVVEGGGQAEAVLHQGLLARAVAEVHPAHLGDGHVTLVDDHQGVLGEVVDQGGRGVPGAVPGEVARVVLDAVAEAQLAQHLHVEERALFEPLRLQQALAPAQERQALAQLFLDGAQGVLDLGGGGDVVARRIHVEPFDPLEQRTLQGIDPVDGLDVVAEQLDPDRHRLLVGREDLDHVAPHPERPPMEIVVVALVLHGHQAADDVVAIGPVALREGQVHTLVGLGGPDAVDARDGGHHHHVPALHERPGGGVPHAVDLVVDEGILLDVRVGLRDVRLGLVVVVVRHEVLDRVAREERPELPEELGGQRLVGGDHQGGPLHGGDQVGDGVGLAGAGHAAQGHVSPPSRTRRVRASMACGWSPRG